MTSPVFFTVTGLYKPFVGDGDDFTVSGDGVTNLTANVIFTPKVKRGNVVTGIDASTIGFIPTPVHALIDTDGLVKLRSEPDLPLRIYDTVEDFPDPGLTTKTYKAEDTGQHYLWDGAAYVETLGYVPLRLLAGENLTGVYEEFYKELWYDVQFTHVKFGAASGKLSGFEFRAPTSDTSVSLVELQEASYEDAEMYVRTKSGELVRTESGELVRRFLVKPGQHADYTLGWDNRMVGDDAISSVNFSLLEASEDLELFSPTQSGYNTQIWVRGTPDVGARFAAVCEITTSKGRTLVQTFFLEAIYPAAASSPAATTRTYVVPSADRYWRLPANASEQITP